MTEDDCDEAHVQSMADRIRMSLYGSAAPTCWQRAGQMLRSLAAETGCGECGGTCGPARPEAVRSAAEFMSRLRGVGIPAPDVVYTSCTGAVVVEWVRDGVRAGAYWTWGRKTVADVLVRATRDTR